MARKNRSRSSSSSKKPKARRGSGLVSSRLRFQSSTSCLQYVDPSFLDDECSYDGEDISLLSTSGHLEGASEIHSLVGACGPPVPVIPLGDGSSVLSSSTPFGSSTIDLEFASGGSIAGMTFTPPSLFSEDTSFPLNSNVLPIPDCISLKGRSLWSFAIVGYFLDGKKTLSFASFWASRIWGPKVEKVFSKGNGLFIFNFSNEDDLLNALNSGPIFFGKSLVILHRWIPGMDLVKATHSSVPIWINLYNIPLDLWHEDGFVFLASQFGKPVRLDDHTKNGNRLSYARICEPHVIEVVIPWKPQGCMNCKIYGHSDKNCQSQQKSGGTENSIGKRKFEWRIKSSAPTNSVPSDSHPELSNPLESSNVLNIDHSPESSARKRVHFILPYEDDLSMSNSGNQEPVTSSDEEGSISTSDQEPVTSSGSDSETSCALHQPDSSDEDSSLLSASAEDNLGSSAGNGLAFLPSNHADFLLDKVLNARKDAFSALVSLKPCLKTPTLRMDDPT